MIGKIGVDKNARKKLALRSVYSYNKDLYNLLENKSQKPFIKAKFVYEVVDDILKGKSEENIINEKWILIAQEEVPNFEDFEIKRISNNEIGNFLDPKSTGDIFHIFYGFYDNDELEFIVKKHPNGSLMFYTKWDGREDDREEKTIIPVYNINPDDYQITPIEASTIRLYDDPNTRYFKLEPFDRNSNSIFSAEENGVITYFKFSSW